MKYFRWSEWDIKWRMSWKNFFLYMASIPNPAIEDKPKVDENGNPAIFDKQGKVLKSIDIRDSDDIF